MVPLGFERGSPHALEILCGQSEVSPHGLVRYSLAACAGGSGFGDIARLFFADEFVVDGVRARATETSISS